MATRQEILDFSTGPAVMTSGCGYAPMFAELPHDVAVLARVVQGLLLHEHVIHSAPQLMREHREGLGFAVFVFQFRKIFLPRLTLANKEDGGFGKGPAQMHIADLFA